MESSRYTRAARSTSFCWTGCKRMMQPMARTDPRESRQTGVKLVIVAAGLLLVLGCVTAYDVAVGVDQDRQGSITVTDQRMDDDRPRTWTVEAWNDGSKPFTGWLRLDIRDEDDDVVFRTWSGQLQINPGSFTMHRFAHDTPTYAGNMTADIVLHHGTDRVTASFPFTTEARDVDTGFTVSHLWTDRDTTALRVTAPNDVDTYYVSVDDRSTRRYSQETVHGAGTQIVELNYTPELIDTEPARVTISSDNGKYHYTGKVELERATGMTDTIRKWVVVLRQNMPFIW